MIVALGQPGYVHYQQYNDHESRKEEERTKPAGQVHQVVGLLLAPLRAGQVLCVLHLCVGWHLHNFVEPEDYYLAA